MCLKNIMIQFNNGRLASSPRDLWDHSAVMVNLGHLCPTQILHHLPVPLLKFPTTCQSPRSSPHHLLVPLLKFPTTCCSLTQIPHHLLVPSLKFPTTCWSPYSNFPPRAGPLAQIPHHMRPSIKYNYRTFCCAANTESSLKAASLH